jgi:hypothetical protein
VMGRPVTRTADPSWPVASASPGVGGEPASVTTSSFGISMGLGGAPAPILRRHSGSTLCGRNQRKTTISSPPDNREPDRGGAAAFAQVASRRCR